jgi:dUTP pyrophosphatase
MIIAPFVQARLETVELLTDTERGTGGFGHTGKS